MADCRRTPVVVLALDQLYEVALFPGVDDVRAAAGCLAEVGLLGGGLRDALRRDEDRAVVAERRYEAERRRLEEDLHGRRVDRFGAVVSLREEADRIDALIPAAGVPYVEVGNDGRRVERRAVGEGHGLFEVESELAGVVILFPALGDPGTDLAVSVDINELVGHVAPYVALEAGDSAVVRDPGAAQRVDEEGDVAPLLRTACTLSRSQTHHCHQSSSCHRGRGNQQAAPGKGERRKAFDHGYLLIVLVESWTC